jgi:hypothetical protein
MYGSTASSRATAGRTWRQRERAPGHTATSDAALRCAHAAGCERSIERLLAARGRPGSHHVPHHLPARFTPIDKRLDGSRERPDRRLFVVQQAPGDSMRTDASASR